MRVRDREEASAGFAGTVHASSVAIMGHGVLLRGASGAGKSDLALRLIDRGASLISDDYTALRRDGDAVIAATAPNIAGQIEVRGLGVIPLPHVEEATVLLLVDLIADDQPEPERYPLDPRHERLCGVDLPVLRIRAFEQSAPLKVELGLCQICDFLWPVETQ